MKQRNVTIVDRMRLARLFNETPNSFGQDSYSNWIRVVRDYLRMTQAELAERANIAQSHLANIETGKIDPQVSTLKKIFEALSCDLIISPKPRKSLEENLRSRARSVALKRLKQSAGTMALEGQAPSADVFRQLLEKQTDEILADRRERLWNKADE